MLIVFAIVVWCVTNHSLFDHLVLVLIFLINNNDFIHQIKRKGCSFSFCCAIILWIINFQYLVLFLQVHFRGYPSNLLIPCEGEESVKWSFINSLKEVSIPLLYNDIFMKPVIYSCKLQCLLPRKQSSLVTEHQSHFISLVFKLLKFETTL